MCAARNTYYLDSMVEPRNDSFFLEHTKFPSHGGVAHTSATGRVLLFGSLRSHCLAPIPACAGMTIRMRHSAHIKLYH